MLKALNSFAALVALPLATALAGCDFFSLSETGDDGPGSGATGGTGPMPGSGGTVAAGMGGSSATGGGGMTSGGAGSGGSAGSSAGSGGAAGSSAGSGGEAGSTAGTAGAAAGGTGGEAAAAGTAGGGAAGTSGGAAGSGGNPNPPTTCEELNSASVEHDGHCYLRVNSPITWRLAKDACAALNAHLVTISSDGRTQEEFDAENDFVWQLAGMMDVWLGLSDGREDTQNGDDDPPFTWVTGEPFTLNHWGADEPNHYQKDCTDGTDCWEHCTFMWQDQSGAWNDEICSFEKQYICEWDSLE